MKTLTNYLSIAFCIVLLWGCQRENDITQIPPSNLRSIVKFTLNPYHNVGNVTIPFSGVINESTKIITIKLPASIRLDSVRPEIIISPWASVSPNSLDYVDLRPDTVEFTVTAQSGKKAVYALVKDLSYKFSNSTMYALNFTNIIDPATGSPLRVSFAAGQTKSITLPAGTDKTQLNVDLELSPDSYSATVTVNDMDISTFRNFSNPVNFTNQVTFRVKSEDGKKTTDYKITIL
ncbi:MAG: cadherin-like beta sandwich domain-containing protein [Bacteroidia bacterium]